MLRRLVARGFDGLLIDGRGTIRGPVGAAQLINGLNIAYAAETGNGGLRLPQITHEDGKQFFLDLRPYRDVWRAHEPGKLNDQDKYSYWERKEREWIAVLWLDGFYTADPSPDDLDRDRIYWGPFDANVVFVNPSDRTRTVDLEFTIGVEVTGPFEFTLSGLVSDRFALDRITDPSDPDELGRHGRYRNYERLELPPGRTRLHIRCRPPAYFLPFDRRNLCYFISNFKLTER
jgi:hypothetical protein